MTAARVRMPAVAAALVAAGLGLAAQREKPLTIIAYGDMRFTDPSNVTATDPKARTVLVARIADEHPDAILLSGDVPWHGGTVGDYDVYRGETAIWRTKKIRVIPALGNHEFSQCEPAVCLENWWTVFPDLRGKRWYSADLTPQVRAIALDTMSPLTAGSEQQRWLEHELSTLPPTVGFVLFAMHHPAVADIQTRYQVDHNPRPNEIALAEFLGTAARTSRARFVVVAGHTHNYERFLQDNVVYMVSGGGGAHPYEVDRTLPDLFKGIEFPNFHYVKMTIANGRLHGEMYRLDEPTAPMPHFTVKDTFDVDVRAVEAAR